MNPVQFHLLVNHAPMFAMLGAVLLLLPALMRGSLPVVRAGLLVAVAGAMIAIPAHLSGEDAEHRMKDVGLMDHDTHERVEAHEDAALPATILTVVTGVVAAAALALGRKRDDLLRRTAVAALVLAMIGLAMMANLAHLGGAIRHPEMLSTTSTPSHQNTNASHASMRGVGANCRT